MKAITLLAILIALFFANGCQREDGASTDSAATATKISDEPLKITEIKVGTEQPKDAQSVNTPITTADPVVVWLTTNSSGKTAKLDAKLFSLSNGQAVGTVTRQLAADVPTTKLAFTPEDRWTAGRYLLEIKLEGKLAEQRDIDIVDMAPQPANK